MGELLIKSKADISNLTKVFLVNYQSSSVLEDHSSEEFYQNVLLFFSSVFPQ